MKIIATLFAAAATLGGCMMSADEPSPPAPLEAACNAEAAAGLVGREPSSELAAEALRLTGARSVRWTRPGMAVTMDYRPDRLNIDIGEDNRVAKFSCG